MKGCIKIQILIHPFIIPLAFIVKNDYYSLKRETGANKPYRYIIVEINHSRRRP